MKVYKTGMSRVYIILDDNIVRGTVTKCEGYFMQGVFMATNAIERKELRGTDLNDTRDLLDLCFNLAYDDKIMEKIKQRFVSQKCK